jgi:serine/threonine-protein kinase
MIPSAVVEREPTQEPPLAAGSDPATPFEPMLRPGEVIGGVYEVLGQIGQGGMGQVYEARDRELERRVALKVQMSHVEGGWLRREAQAMAAVRHPGVVTVYALGRHGELDYVVMERIYGVTLAALLEQRQRMNMPCTVEETVDILLQAADALAAVSRAGISHRDIKPDNIMVTPSQRVVVMDFGVFRTEHVSAQPPMLSGSPRYMAPEVIQGKVQAGQGHLADLYALGITGFEMLTGRTPFHAEDMTVVLHSHLTDTAPDVRTLRADTPEPLAELIARLLSKDPDQRLAGAEAVAWELRAIRIGKKAPMRPLSILVVDDDPFIAKLLSNYLVEHYPEVEVRLAADGHAALEQLAKGIPALLLLDVNMPRMNGIELLMHLKGTQLADGMTVVSMSSRVSHADVQLMDHLGVAKFVPKDAKFVDSVVTVIDELRASRR